MKASGARQVMTDTTQKPDEKYKGLACRRAIRLRGQEETLPEPTRHERGRQ